MTGFGIIMLMYGGLPTNYTHSAGLKRVSGVQLNIDSLNNSKEVNA